MSEFQDYLNVYESESVEERKKMFVLENPCGKFLSAYSEVGKRYVSSKFEGKKDNFFGGYFLNETSSYNNPQKLIDLDCTFEPLAT